MSGGSYDYIHYKIEEFAERLEVDQGTQTSPQRRSFCKLLKLVAKAAHDIEWVDSCDYGPGNEVEAIMKCFSFMKSDPNIIAKAHAYDKMIELLSMIISQDAIIVKETSENDVRANGM